MLYPNKLKLHEKFRSIILFSALAHVLNLKNKTKKSPKKIHPEKIFSYCKNRNFLALILTEILIFSYISKNGCLHYLTSSLKKQKNPSRKKSLYSRKWNFLALILKNSYISRYDTLHFPDFDLKIFPWKSYSKKDSFSSKMLRKRNFLIFWKRYIENLSIFRNLAYLEREAYSEPWYLQQPRHIQNTEKIAT